MVPTIDTDIVETKVIFCGSGIYDYSTLRKYVEELI